MSRTYTVNDILGSPQIVTSVIDRARAVEQDKPFWRDYLRFQETTQALFKTAYGSKSAVRMGSVLADYGNKPLRGREGLTPGVLEVATLGDRFQMGKDRLEQLQDLIARMTASGMSAESVTEVTNFLVDDFRELLLAPEKRMDKVLSDLLLTGASSIRVKDNPKGVEILDIEIPSNAEKATGPDKGKVFQMLQKIATKYKRYAYREILMSNETFTKYFMLSDEFKALIKVKLGTSETSMTGLLTVGMLTALFGTVGLPPVRVVSNFVRDLSDTDIPMLEEGKIAFVPRTELGFMRWKETYESKDNVPGKVYSRNEGGLLVSTERTNEGRFMEYECKWVPEIKEAKAIVSVDLTAVSL